MLRDKYGWLKLTMRSMPSKRADPRAIDEYPEKSP